MAMTVQFHLISNTLLRDNTERLKSAVADSLTNGPVAAM